MSNQNGQSLSELGIHCCKQEHKIVLSKAISWKITLQYVISVFLIVNFKSPATGCFSIVTTPETMCVGSVFKLRQISRILLIFLRNFVCAYMGQTGSVTLPIFAL